MDRDKSFLGGLVLLLLAPTLVLAGFAAYTLWANARPQPGPVETRVRPQVVWPWQETVDLITVRGDLRPPEAPPPRPVDMVFLIDVSGSMTGSLPAMRDAAHQVALDLAHGQPGRVRFALIAFDTEAEVLTGWTTDPAVLKGGLDRLASFTGQNDTRKAFLRLDEVLRQTRREATPAAVFYTDGYLDACLTCLFPRAMSEQEMVAAAKKLRDRGVALYSVGLPGEGSHPLMVDITGAVDRVFDPGTVSGLGRAFREVANEVLGVPSGGGLITQRLDGRHFSAPLEGTDWALGPGGALQLELGDIPQSASTYWHPLVPHTAGLWRVGLEPPRLTWVDKATGAPVEAAAVRRPTILVVTWFTLFLAALPALVWALVHRPRGPESRFETLEPLPPRPLRRLHLPARLPALPVAPGARGSALPTLFVGLGGAGRWALHAVRADLAQSHAGAPGQPYRFLCIDFDRREEESQPPFTPWEGHPVEALVAPPEIARAAAYLPEPGAVPETWSWFDAERYRDAARDDLNLATGARGDRALARLALFRWLERGGVLGDLARLCREVADLPSADGTWQVVVFASRDGGTGSGSFLDFGRLLQRLGRDLQAQGRPFAPEVLGVLCDSPEGVRSENREALALEIQSATRAGGFPTRTTYVAGDPVLDRADRETPYHWIFSVSGPDKTSVAGQCGELGPLLVERRPRRALLEAGERVAATGRVAAVQVHGVHVLPTLVQEQVEVDLLLRLLGPDVLLDLRPAPNGGFEAGRVADEAAAGLLAVWAGEEAPETPLHLLLTAAAQDEASWLDRLFDRPSAPSGDGLTSALAAAANRRLYGRRSAPGSPWQRGWMPGEALAVLRLLERRLESVAARLSRPEAMTAVTEVRRFAATLADGLAAWTADLCRVCEELAGRKRRLAEHVRTVQRLHRRTTLEPPARPEEIERWARECLEAWLGTADVVSPLREHLFFAFAEGSPAAVLLRCHVAEPEDFRAAAPALEALTALARSLARLVPTSHVGGALSRLAGDRRSALAGGLVDRGAHPAQVLVAAPVLDGLPPAEAGAVAELRQEIPQPADHGTRTDVAMDDLSAVRRLELQAGFVPEGGFSAVVEAAEQEAERVRQKVQRKYRLAVPPFPAELRVALARPEAFRSFARAYSAGRIVRRPDIVGREQWFFLDRQQFLTFGAEAGLAAAAAGYVASLDHPEASFSGSGGELAPLHQWERSAGMPDDHVLALAAIEVCRDERGG